MKNFLFIVFTAFTLLNTACSPGKVPVPPVINMFINAKRNDTLWNAFPGNNTFRNDTITIKAIGINQAPFQDTLNVRVRYTGTGDYKLVKSQVSYHSRAGGTAPVDKYTLDTLYANTLTITAYDQTAVTMKGTFNIKFVDFKAPSYKPADISFLGGQFYIALHK
ncbi:MAG: hypothetical protein JWP94_1043 [Mucilaginibacter sp.]|nr:hypothetical protein [Mucilaginibacter sp.]